MKSRALKLTSYIYLLLVPFIGTVLAFAIGYISYKVYLPVWILNTVLMCGASWILGLHVIRSSDNEIKGVAIGAFFLVIPFILASMFAGLGPPPETSEKWIETATEQQVRYFMLVIIGVSIAFGFTTLRNQLRVAGENIYSSLGLTCILIAMPLFIINMLYWGFFLPELFKLQLSSASKSLPDWFTPFRKLFGLISVVEVGLTYLATILFAAAFKKVKWFNKTSCNIYIIISAAGLLIMLLSVFFPDILNPIADKVSIPALPFLMPYFIGVNLLRKVGQKVG